METFDKASDAAVIEAAKKDFRYARTVQFPMHPFVDDCLRALKYWKERDLDVDVARNYLHRIRKAISWLEGKEEER